MKYILKTLQTLCVSATVCGTSASYAGSPKVIEYYSFDKKENVHSTDPNSGWENGCRLPKDSYIVSDTDSGNKTWDLTVKENGTTPDSQTKIIPSFLGTGIPGHGNYISVAATNSSKGSQYLYAQGEPLSLSKTASWNYSVTMWVNPAIDGTNANVTLFSIGTETNGLRFKCSADKNSEGKVIASYLECDLYATMVGFESPLTLSFGKVLLDHNFNGTNSDWHHLGISFGKDTNNNLTINYYSEGNIVNPEEGTHQSSIGNAFTTVKTDKGISLDLNSLNLTGLEDVVMNGLSINSDPLNGLDSGGSVRYDDIKIYNDLLLDPNDVKDSMTQGTGAVPEASTSALALLGLVGLSFRRRR